jgi:hypothetical protein
MVLKLDIVTNVGLWRDSVDSSDMSTDYSQRNQYIELMDANINTGYVVGVLSDRDSNLNLKEYGLHYILYIYPDDTLGTTGFCSKFRLLTL